MSRRPQLLAAAVLLTACAVGPAYRAPALAPAGAAVGVEPVPDTLAAFYDSLARGADSTAPASRPLAPDSADLAWLGILRDTTLVGLVTTAVRENRDVQGAQARIREFRAELGATRSELFPQVSANASASTNQIAIGAIPPTAYDALRVTQANAAAQNETTNAP